ncbi:MAG: tetratricopeptide repeat protein [Candidatus Riflebacteria bacterium]|nr:tetratricopeptide repeat protein [Candidatus Riflebacteria bacterium]
MRTIRAALVLLACSVPVVTVEAAGPSPGTSAPPAFVGSERCRRCHEPFYRLWASSHHGLALQPFSPSFARGALSTPTADVVVGTSRYRADIPARAVVEHGPGPTARHPIEHVMGGKNVYYFLTTLDRGRLQTLPVAYDVRKKEWFDMAASGLRHVTDRSVDWRDPVYTFNTACYRCHVSQLSTNYEPKTDTYATRWAEPGINCETCHGPGGEHARLFSTAPKARPPRDPKLVVTRTFSPEQMNSVCSTCHAKMIPLTSTFRPGDRFFDHYDLTTLEDPDFHADGRDKGENYTFTTWRRGSCSRSGRLHCVHCHTSSGRYRFADAKDANRACLPCHDRQVASIGVHSHHGPGKGPDRCVSCHMPTTEFARMRRTDHSMLPPTPAATVAFGSPNACTLCHTDRDAAWADKAVRAWHRRDYQAPVLHRAGLVDLARKRKWERLPEMLALLDSPDREEIAATSLLRLLRTCPDDRKRPAIVKALGDRSPLVRSAAADALGFVPPDRPTADALGRAVGDDFRLVRIRAAGVLAAYPPELLAGVPRNRLDRAVRELVESLSIRPDFWTDHYNLGNYHLGRGDSAAALSCYRTALSLAPRAVMPMVNASIASSRLGDLEAAKRHLKRALDLEPDSAAAHFNLGLLLGEQNDPREAERHLRAAVRSDPSMAQAAHNLAVLLSSDRIEEALEWSRKAYAVAPCAKYGYTLAFFEARAGNRGPATGLLQQVVARWPSAADSHLLLGSLLEGQARWRDAAEIYRRALAMGHFSGQDRRSLESGLRRAEAAIKAR